MKCKCGTELAESIKFCPECGKKVEKPKPIPQSAETVIMQLQPLLTFNEATKLLRICRNTLYSLIEKGEIPFVVIGNRKKFLTKELLEWVASKQTTAS
ncbi:excision promoter, Xis [Desulfofarcimen acetoxidans DSM 771]|uniref:Excision promoter, Xis n=1 Tax=Desulfofarcimen acetoxidans (strain ATCC 49208 / DSM 771 / KCTC 5769 / VKM B-1644 / 5575) TaxID=485916 RepID=C8VWM3_DESAS|nr:helix-turn-helix domain-containing protein [Desulfofarcimen acetoxidans]ACV64387.1 excision promoter, Xis [Desulfofarcimen acetoxidans DSM 771]